MANMCNFLMKVSGNKENINAFISALEQKDRIWMGRGAEILTVEFEDAPDKTTASISGWCKNSMEAALIHNAVSMRTDPEKWFFGNINTDDLEFLTLIEASERWDLAVEAYSEESGCEFSEHIKIIDGMLIENETVHFCEYWLSDYDSKEAFEKAIGQPISDKVWAENDTFCTGGFASWTFSV